MELRSDYSIHEGQLGDWFSHRPFRCSSGGALSLALTPSVAPGGLLHVLPVLAKRKTKVVDAMRLDLDAEHAGQVETLSYGDL